MANRPSGLLFDMDGTLTEPLLDFPRIKAEMGIGDCPILEALNAMSPVDRAAAEAILQRHEKDAAARSMLNPGCRELLQSMEKLRLPAALITRNGRQSVQTVVELHGLAFQCLIAREDAPFKPDPTPLRLACRKLQIDCASAWMIGDGQYDVEAGRAAGIKTIWISHDRHRPFAAEPWRTVRNLVELAEILEECCRTPR